METWGGKLEMVSYQLVMTWDDHCQIGPHRPQAPAKPSPSHEIPPSVQECNQPCEDG